MNLFKELNERGHEQVSFFHDPNSGLKGIVAIHNTVLGPALGGCRMWQYENEETALVDVLRLSKGMTYKAAIAGLNLGGGKAVIIGDSKTQKTENLFRSFGRFVEGFYNTLSEIFHRSNKENISTNEASDREAEDRILKIGELKTFYLPEKKTFKIRNA